ncbi:protein diaphanous-like [Sitodiplosis mosellana]|uniref:protein diaphanous-like n=1 Tax=Sitodiplosis mosellana TaxID=263140 RepID=UPI00244413C5|nr:protein diaphanous-like [Sitodiplosis mosellana]
MLNANFIMGLIKCLPREDQINQLRKLRNDGVTLIDVEDFLASLCDIYRIVPRLHCIKFLMEFNDMVKNVEVDIEVATIACDEVLSCSRFHKILRLILSIGNIMNAGTKIGGAVAFELPALTTLIDTKSADNKRTLFDFIVETAVEKYPDLLYFADELCHLHEAVDTKFSNIEETIKKIEGLLHFVGSELEKVKASPSVHDTTFIDIMSDFITHHNFDNIGQLTKNMHHMRESYMKVAMFFAFDMNKYKISECLKDIITFKNTFKQKLTEIAKSCKSNHKLSIQKLHPESSGCKTTNGTCRSFTIKLTRMTEEEIAFAIGSKTSRKRKHAD